MHRNVGDIFGEYVLRRTEPSLPAAKIQILFLVTGACHCAVGAVPAAGGFAFFLIFYEFDYDQRNDKGKHKAYYNCGKIICEP